MSRQAPIDYIERTRDQYAALGYPPYEWVSRSDPPELSPLKRPITQSKLALIASGGIYRKGQIAFHFKDDYSYREISTDAPVSELRATHFAYDVRDAREDVNVVFPLDTLRRAVAEGRLGALGPNAYTFMGGIYSARKVQNILAPALADRLIDDEVDIALLVPA